MDVGDHPLTLEDVARVLAGEPVRVSEGARARVEAAHRRVQALARETVAYGINTGVGKLATTRIPQAELSAFQENILRSHAVGVGPPAPPPVVRTTLFLRLALLSRGFSGVSPRTLDYLVRFLNEGVVPVVPRWGSVGASGDLAPLAHVALTFMGEGEVWFRGERLPARRVLDTLGLTPWKPEPKEALSLINGTSYSTAVLLQAFFRIRRLLDWAVWIAALSFEALAGLPSALDPRVLKLRGFHVDREGERIRDLIAESGIPRDEARVQDAYSLRCTPQVQGSVRWVVSWVAQGLEEEINAVTDNPLVLDSPPYVVSCGNFHGHSVALMADTLVVAAGGLGVLSERRTFRMLTPELSGGLPPFLAYRPGLESGLMMVQVTQAALVGRLRDLAYPSSLSSVPTSGEQEDLVPMATNAAYRALEVSEVLRDILAAELLVGLAALAWRVEQGGRPSPRLIPLWEKGRSLWDLPFRGDAVWAQHLQEAQAWLEEPPPPFPEA